jgi:hypothetical protein
MHRLYIDIHTYTYNRGLNSHKERNYVVCRKMDRTRDYHVKQSEPDWERQILCDPSHILNLELKNEWQACKTGSPWGWVPSGVRRVKGEDKREGWVWPRYFIHMYE